MFHRMNKMFQDLRMYLVNLDNPVNPVYKCRQGSGGRAFIV